MPPTKTLPPEAINTFWRLDAAMCNLLERVLPSGGFEYNLPTPLRQETRLQDDLEEMCVPRTSRSRLTPAFQTLAHPTPP
jgi:hypothetical protein